MAYITDKFSTAARSGVATATQVAVRRWIANEVQHALNRDGPHLERDGERIPLRVDSVSLQSDEQFLLGRRCFRVQVELSIPTQDLEDLQRY